VSILESAIGWLAPALCVGCGAEGSAFCVDCADRITNFGERCWRCNRLSPLSKTCPSCRHIGGPGSVWIVTNYDKLTQPLVRKYKFGHLRAAAEPLAKMMVETMLMGKDITADYLVVPVPTATSRRRQRGFGHSELLAKQVAIRLRCQSANALRRLGQSRQLGSRREDRLTQLAGSFAVRRPGLVQGQKVLLVDDVLTTGGTIIAATRALKAAGAAGVDALLFAKRL
jgi:ComF family protein